MQLKISIFVFLIEILGLVNSKAQTIQTKRHFDFVINPVISISQGKLPNKIHQKLNPGIQMNLGFVGKTITTQLQFGSLSDNIRFTSGNRIFKKAIYDVNRNKLQIAFAIYAKIWSNTSNALFINGNFGLSKIYKVLTYEILDGEHLLWYNLNQISSFPTVGFLGSGIKFNHNLRKYNRLKIQFATTYNWIEKEQILIKAEKFSDMNKFNYRYINFTVGGSYAF